MQKLLERVLKYNQKYTKDGKVASYIPELSKANGNDLGISIISLNGNEYSVGISDKKFTIQSISKVLTLLLAIMDDGKNNVFSKVGVEPTGQGFNSIVNLEIKAPLKPFNPMVNSGAIVTTSLVYGNTQQEKFERIVNFTKKITGNPNITYNEDVYLSEKRTGDRNRALAYFMKSNNIFTGNVEEVLDLYFKQCSMEVTCRDIARIGAVLANEGVLTWSGERILTREACRIVKTIMVTCGMYDASGAFAVEVGVPAKSGVSGGIMTAVPNRMGIGVYGPALDAKGNSVAGLKVLQNLSEELDLSIF